MGKYSNYGEIVDFVLTSGIMTVKSDGYGYFGGTSAVAPVISGLLALKMAQDPKKEIAQLLED